MNLKQFDIVTVDLNPTKWSEQKWNSRPCVILQSNAGLNKAKTVLIAPLTSKNIDKIFPFEIFLKKNKENNLDENSKAKFEQIRVIDKRRIQKNIWKLSREQILEFYEAISIIFDLRKDFI